MSHRPGGAPAAGRPQAQQQPAARAPAVQHAPSYAPVDGEDVDPYLPAADEPSSNMFDAADDDPEPAYAEYDEANFAAEDSAAPGAGGDAEYAEVSNEDAQQAFEQDDEHFTYLPAPVAQQQLPQQPQRQAVAQHQPQHVAAVAPRPAQQPAPRQPAPAAAVAPRRAVAAVRAPIVAAAAAPMVEEDPFADPSSPSYGQTVAAPQPRVTKQQANKQMKQPRPPVVGGAAVVGQVQESARAQASSSPAPGKSAFLSAAPPVTSTASLSRSTSAGNVRAPLQEHKSDPSAPRPSSAAGSADHASSSSAAARVQDTRDRMESFVSKNISALEKGSTQVLNSMRGLEEGPSRATVEDEQLASHNYDLWEDHVNQLALDADSKGGSSSRHGHTLTFLQLLLTISVALLTALAMYFVSHIVDLCAEIRVENTLDLVRGNRPYAAYFALLGISLLLAGLATTLVTFFAPHAKGGGVPYVQAYLNGTNVASYFSPRIVLIKILALGFTIASGLSLGMEGPFVFIGSGIAILCTRALETLSFHQRLGGRYARILKNINEERVFMAGGMAAGLAVAFNAPIAGVLMALEGSTAFLTVPVVLRIFGCAMFATFFNDVAKAGFGPNIKTHNLIQVTAQPDAAPYAWVLYEIIAFAAIAVLGGLLGALAIWINVKVTKWRHHHVEPHPPRNELNTLFAVGEVLGITFLTATAWFVLPYVFGCRAQHEQCFPTIAIPHRCMPVQCPSSFYSEIGTIIYSSPDTIARILFDRSLLPVNDLSPFPLLVYAAFYICFVAVAYGAHVPGGLFVPSVVVGGCMGRVFGWVCHTYVSSAINPGVYALLGAASMFGGFTRLALPAVMMLTEMVGESEFLLPIMFCTVLAKVVSDEIVPPLYPQHMAIEGIPTLGDKLNPLIAPLQAKHIMQRSFYSVQQLDTLHHILSVLDSSRSMLLPVVSSDGQGKFVGMVMRRSVIYALKYTKLYKDHAEFLAESQGSEEEQQSALVVGGAGPNQRRTTSSLLEVEKKMGDVRDTGAESLDEKFDDKFASYLVNITPFMDAGALTAHEETSAKRIAAIFRRMGISHLGVSDANNTLVGVITRRHLIKAPAALPATPHLAPQRGVEQLLAADDLEASPEAVLELARYDEALQLEQSAMGPLSVNQRAAAAAAAHKRSNSILGDDNPAVKFDDEEDEVDEPPPDDQDEQQGGGAGGGDSQLYDEDEEIGTSSGQSRAFREATGGAIGSIGATPRVTVGATPRTALRHKQSSLSRLNDYTKQLQ